jgi:Protein of unknown function (DUF2637)
MASVTSEPRGFLSPALARQAWKVVAVAALAFSAWSLFVVARTWGVPVPIAVITSCVFDGAMLLASDYSIRHVHARARGRGLARTAMVLFAVASVALNVEHAALAHDPPAAAVLFAAPAIIGLLLLEVHARYRFALSRSAVPVQEELPLIRGWSWLLHPAESWEWFRESVRPAAGLPALGTGVVPDHDHDPGVVVCSRCGTRVQDPLPAPPVNGNGVRQGAWS